jgi:1-acyl-sn-glycerol-3-phosphate acyltransferase
VAKESLGRIPFLGWHLQRTGHLLVNRRNPGADIVTKMKRLVGERHSLIVFPEGTRSVDGAVARFKKGSFLVAVDARLPVVPVSVGGSGQVMRNRMLVVGQCGTITTAATTGVCDRSSTSPSASARSCL